MPAIRISSATGRYARWLATRRRKQGWRQLPNGDAASRLASAEVWQEYRTASGSHAGAGPKACASPPLEPDPDCQPSQPRLLDGGGNRPWHPYTPA